MYEKKLNIIHKKKGMQTKTTSKYISYGQIKTNANMLLLTMWANIISHIPGGKVNWHNLY